jgi:hypothetical protein
MERNDQDKEAIMIQLEMVAMQISSTTDEDLGIEFVLISIISELLVVYFFQIEQGQSAIFCNNRVVASVK